MTNKTTTITRMVDKMGRIVIPKEFRSKLNIRDDVDKLDIFLEDEIIIIKKHQSSCYFCSSSAPSVCLNNKMVCVDCIKKLEEMKKIFE